MDLAARVIEVAIIADRVLATFSDGRITLLDADDLRRQSTAAPAEPEGSTGDGAPESY